MPDIVTLKTTDLTRAEQVELAQIIFDTVPMNRPYTIRKYLAQVMCKRQRVAGMEPEPALRHIAGEV